MNSKHTILAIVIVASLFAHLSHSQNLATTNGTRFDRGGIAATTAGGGGHSNIVSVYVRGNERGFTPEDIADKARNAVSMRSPNFSLADAEVVVWIDVKQTNRLAAVFFPTDSGGQ